VSTLHDCPYCGRKCYGATCRTCQPLAAAERAEREGDFNAEIRALEAEAADDA
jgi:hypothetical protein